MADSLNQMINTVSAFCREHADVLLISGAVIIVCIVIIGIIAGKAKKNKEKPGQDVADCCEGRESADSKGEERESTEAKIPEPAAGETKSYHGKLQNILEELSGIAAGGLEEIEIKIQGAEVRIRYSSKELAAREAERLSAEQAGRNPDCCAAGDENIDEKIIEEKITPDEISGEMACSTGENGQINQTVMDKDAELSEYKVKKFGPDNIDTTRSGRTFTEQELSDQIRD